MNLLLAAAVGILGTQVWVLSSRGLPAKELEALSLVHRQILESYVEPQEGGRLLDRAIEGMVRTLDRWSAYIPPERVAGFEEENRGAYTGIGLLLAPGLGTTVLFPFPGSPAERAGIRVGDRIVQVDGTELAAIDPARLVQEAQKLLRGPAGTRMRLTVEREGTHLELEAERAEVRRRSVRWIRLLDAEHGVGYLHVTAFQPDTVAEVDAALQELLRQGARAVVLDLRFNTGGLLDQAILLANRFLPKGNLCSTRRRDRDTLEAHDARPQECRHPELPVVLLVNEETASASEVVAGALQDHARARLVGTRTYGKGVVQTIYRWKSLDFRLRLTTAHYYTPKGRNIQRGSGAESRPQDPGARGGIPADVVVELGKEQNERVRGGLGATEVPERYRVEVAAFAQASGLRLEQPLPPAEDPQLRAAVELAAGTGPATREGGR